MKKLFAFLGLFSVHLCAQSAFASLLLIPDNAHALIGIYGGPGSMTQEVTIDSTDHTRNGSEAVFHDVRPLIGAFVGLGNDRYRIGVAFDYRHGGSLSMQRLLFNADFILPYGRKIHPLIGAGIGAVDSRAKIDNRTVSFDNGTYTLRGGMEYRYDTHQAFECLMEYSRFLNTGSDTYVTEDVFTSYDLHEQNSIFLRLGYTYRF